MEGEAVFLLQQHGPLAQPQLVQAEQQDDDAAGPGEPHLVVVEELPQGGEAQPQQEEGEADAHHEKEGVEEDLSPGIAADAVLAHHSGAAGQIADVQRHQRQHAGGEEAQRALQKDSDGGYAGLNGKAHGDILLNMKSWRHHTGFSGPL